MAEIKKLNSLEELNQLNVRDKIPTWNPIFGKSIMTITENSDTKFSLIEISAEIGTNYFITEYAFNKSNTQFCYNGGFFLQNYLDKKTYSKGDKEYSEKLNLIRD
jgi:hypothetical protein